MDNREICVCCMKPEYDPDFEDCFEYKTVSRKDFLKLCYDFIGSDKIYICYVIFSGSVFSVVSEKDCLSKENPLISVFANNQYGDCVSFLAGKLVIAGSKDKDGFFKSLTEDQKSILDDCATIAGGTNSNGDFCEQCWFYSDNLIN